MEHHVYFWLKDEHQNDQDRAAFEASLDQLLKTPNIASGGWGKPSNTPERPVTDKSFDYGLYLRFDSLEKHDAYQVHPEHDVFIDASKHLWAKVLVMDVD
ncbi:Stress responsive A/B Barrel Domain [Rubritalea squalenifaciens DSM 18772]|uniref:Stress responsive A/B Barrel Domain n=2 Tax=Rubritalea TaxID=361050 RepID=A0A1M6PGJ6_9BACT|nr:Dabb family protein [Rubritalea squalenifaciens]SHK07007.1 Stress responsive A/B Barrel Domain [Rubritalea squalenifaciens DSM 18772]